jgi:tryptophanyl-tRNA synthetase
MKQRILTGITTTGTPHIGNYVGAIRPAIKLSHEKNVDSFFFLANLHALVKCQKPEEVRQSSREIAASWLALGLDVEKAVFYQQSDIPEITELSWILTCVTAKGLMNRSHAYKAAVAENAEGNDPDKGVTMGLFCYPILMSADILMFNPHKVPVGRDQIQHLEMARDIGQRFNHIYGETFTLPEMLIDEDLGVLMGLDGRKMSKSYHNTIPLFCNEKDLLKLIRKIKTDSLEPGEPKDPANSSLFSWYQAFASENEINDMRKQYEEGIGWGAVKDALFEVINRELKEPRERYEEWMANPKEIERVLLQGAEKARAISIPLLQDIKKKVGIG